MKSTDDIKKQIIDILQVLKISMKARERQQAYCAILDLDLNSVHATLNEVLRNETDSEILAYSAELLLERDHKSGIPLVLPLLHTEEAHLRRHICGLLSNYRDRSTVEPLIERLQKDTSADVRVIAAFALSKIRDERALPALLEAQALDTATDFEGTSVSKAATKAILSIQGK